MEDNNIIERLKILYPALSKSQKRIADFVVEHYDRAAFITAAKLGENVGVSESTVVRFASELGYDGYPEFQHVLREIIKNKLTHNYTDSYGGPDKADESFTNLQKAINFSMTSFLTTGGIRGSKGTKMEKFVPRTFNMGFSNEVYKEVGGFKDMFGEDIDLSLRIRNQGYTCQLISEAFVYHKRRVNLRSFYRQVHVFGMARISLYLLHPKSLKLVHILPALFTIISSLIILLSLFYPSLLLLLLIYYGLILIVSTFEYKNISIGFLSVITSAIQLYGYGWGFIKSYIDKVIFGKKQTGKNELEKYYNKK